MFAVFKRNFFAYFLNPTGYVFICVFVLLNSIAAFLPDEFVNSNLANLAQLNLWFPLIALVFVPAVAMSVWADERRFGTDELLTTLPLTPRQIVVGKYLAAGAVYTVSLLFSLVSNYCILEFLGEPDRGLFLSTYLGYWLVGLGMTAIATVVSYLTPQLTVAYILGALFNVPLLALQWADALPFSNATASALRSFGLAAFFEPFGRGVATLSGVLYFLAIPTLAVCVCVILLKRRTWPARSERRLALRAVWRLAAGFVLAVSLVGIVRDRDVRIDCTEERLGSLSPETLALLDRDFAPYPVVIEARLSPQVPQEYVQTKLNVVNVLNELKNRSKSPVFLDIQETLPNSEEARRLERQYDIRPKKVVFNSRGQAREDSIFMSIVFRCGPKTLAIPFLNRGLSVEYELVSALMNVANPPKKRIGIVATDAGVLGRYDDFGREIQRPWPLVDELSKQYYVESVDLREPVEPGRYDALLAVQPSSLSPPEAVNFINAVRTGQPTAIFEDPRPIFLEFLPGTTERRQPTPTNPIPPQKAELGLLWTALGVRFESARVLWKNYNPYPKLAGLSEEYLFVDARPIRLGDAAETEKNAENAFAPFNPDEPTAAALERVLFPFAGALSPAENAETTFVPLVRTEAGGSSSVSDVVPMGIRTQSRKRQEAKDVYTLAALIAGPVPEAFRLPDSKVADPKFNVALIADVDMATPGFFALREMGADPRGGLSFDFDNITFVLNVIDRLAGDDALVAIRNRRPKHRTLTAIEETTRQIRDEATIAQIAYMKEFEEERRREEAKLQQTIQELSSRDDGQKELGREESAQLQSAIVATQQRLTKILDEKQRLFDRKVEESRREVDEYVRQTQGRYKAFAAILPPLAPLAIGIGVFLYRRRQLGRRLGV